MIRFSSVGNQIVLKLSASSRAIIEQKKFNGNCFVLKLARGDCSRFACNNEKRPFFLNIFPFCSIIISDEAASLLGGAQPTYCLAESAHLNANVPVGTCSNSFQRALGNCSTMVLQRPAKSTIKVDLLFEIDSGRMKI
jgi:hypothetical protein